MRQQVELLCLVFFLWYGIEFIFRYFQYKSWMKAYRNISFEREAYSNESDFEYNKKVGFWRFTKYLNK